MFLMATRGYRFQLSVDSVADTSMVSAVSAAQVCGELYRLMVSSKEVLE